MAPHSQMSKRSYSHDMVHSLFQSFTEESSHVILFLKFIESIELLVIHEGQEKPESVYKIFVKNSTEEIRKKRSSMADIVSDKQFLEKADNLNFIVSDLQIEVLFFCWNFVVT